jgi:hypothetical protein
MMTHGTEIDVTSLLYKESSVKNKYINISYNDNNAPQP